MNLCIIESIFMGHLIYNSYIVKMRYNKEYQEEHKNKYTFIDWVCKCGSENNIRFNTRRFNNRKMSINVTVQCIDCNHRMVRYIPIKRS